MDPNEALRHLLNAILDGDIDEAREFAQSIQDWEGLGGFSPDYKKAVWYLYEDLIKGDE